jgi:flavin-dependent dehydrogenase
VRIAIVGAGPAGSLLAWHLARAGAEATLFDASHPREKPCGGGVTPAALPLLPPAPVADPLPGRRVDVCRFDSGEGCAIEIRLPSPMLIAARRELDSWLLRRALEAGARHRAERVVAVDDAGGLRVAAAAGREVFDVVVGADGAGSLVRRSLLGATPAARLLMAAGWLADGDAPMLVRFTPGLAGYLWVFPRPGHVEVGICAPLAAVPTRALVARLDEEAAREFPQLVPPARERQAHTIPFPADEASLLEIAGPRWALVGDAAALADPLTGEGIRHALRSGQLLAQTLLRDGSPLPYPRRLLCDFGRELVRAAQLRRRFFAPGFTARMVRYGARSPAIRELLAELVLGQQGYVGLKWRLLRAGPRFLLDGARARLRHG